MQKTEDILIKISFVEKYGKDKIVKNMIIQKAQDIVMDNAVYK